MTHEDARRVLEVIQDRGTVGHWSLVQPGIDSVTATGDIRLNFEGIITGFSCRSADFRIPLEVKAEHMGLVVPRHILTFESPTLAKLFGVNTEQKPDGELFLLGLKKIVIYSPTVFIFAMVHDKEPVTLQNAPYTVAFYETDFIRMIGFANQSSAQQVYDQVSSEYAKVFINKHGANVRCRILNISTILTSLADLGFIWLPSTC